MELREFVKATLVQIIEGVQDARENVATMEAAVGSGGGYSGGRKSRGSKRRRQSKAAA